MDKFDKLAQQHAQAIMDRITQANKLRIKSEKTAVKKKRPKAATRSPTLIAHPPKEA